MCARVSAYEFWLRDCLHWSEISSPSRLHQEREEILQGFACLCCTQILLRHAFTCMLERCFPCNLFPDYLTSLLCSLRRSRVSLPKAIRDKRGRFTQSACNAPIVQIAKTSSCPAGCLRCSRLNLVQNHMRQNRYDTTIRLKILAHGMLQWSQGIEMISRRLVQMAINTSM